MDTEAGAPNHRNPPLLSWVNLSRNILLAYQSLGVVYGDLSTSPLYVYTNTMGEKSLMHLDEETIFGSFSLIFWTLTLIPLLKYVFILLSADDNSEGGTFALYTLLCRHGKFNLLPNQQAADEELSSYKHGPSSNAVFSSTLKRILEKHGWSRTVLLVVVLLGVSMLIGDGVLSPAMSILAALSGVRKQGTDFSEAFFVSSGTEAMFADLGHFTAMSIRLAFTCAVYPCLVVQYMGQAAFLSKNLSAIDNSFYHSIPGPVYWPVFVIATLATVVGSQAVITATFSIINQCHALGCFPRVKVVHTSKDIFGRIYIPEINWILMLLTLAVTVGFRNTNLIGNAYGLAVVLVMFVTTFLMALVIIFVWEKSIFVAMAFLLFFWAIEGLYLSAVLVKVPQGGWVPLVLAFFFMTVMCIWHYGTHKKFSFETQNRASLKWLLGLGPSLGIVRVPGIGLIYSGLVTGIPTIFSHFVTNLPAFHKILVFVCIKSVPVPYVSTAERFLVGRVCPRPYRMYRCTVRYGYKDIQRNDEDFENLIIQNLAQFILMEAMEEDDSDFETSPLDGRMTVVSGERMPSSSSLIVSEHEDISVSTGRSASSRSLWSVNDENPPQKKKRVRYQVPNIPEMDPHVREELTDIIEAKEAGVAYIMGNTYVKARKSSSFLERFAIDVLYTFLRKNCRGPAVCLNIPHVSMIEVGMIYHV
ncbi:potassium transporter 7 isoform X2 [Neltuma alba]|uniref:potassium transporter 7 isoform X2 n=1 Tax=Neltuma alba TaxID=207710 RepID=UPI0010A3F59E|nr:potassium transporter 7-like isoform X2 [Prosopis alba]